MKGQIRKYSILRFFSFKRMILKIWLKGDKVRCNICESTFKRFRSFGHIVRENALCPNCYSTESTRLLWFYLKNEVLGQKNKNNFLCFNTESILIEKLKKHNINITYSDVNYLNRLGEIHPEKKLKGGKADVILFTHVLEYVKNEEAVFEELKRLLRTGGFVLIQTIVNWEMDRTYDNPKTSEDRDRLKSYFEPGAQRIYGYDFKKLLGRAGFKVEKIDYADQLGTSAKKYYRLGDGTREMIFKCKKI